MFFVILHNSLKWFSERKEIITPLHRVMTTVTINSHKVDGR